MNTIILKLAIQAIKPNVEHIATLISYLPKDQQENALIIYAGIEYDSIPATSTVDTNATLISYNPLTGNVEYEYDKKEEKYFNHDYATKEEAQAAIYDGSFVNGSKQQSYLYTGGIVRVKSNCLLSRWLR